MDDLSPPDINFCDSILEIVKREELPYVMSMKLMKCMSISTQLRGPFGITLNLEEFFKTDPVFATYIFNLRTYTAPDKTGV
jgi:hypothetical protein